MMGIHNKWSSEEVEFLHEHAGVRSRAYLSRKLGRTPTAIQVKSKRIGVNQRDNYYTARLAGEVFGVDSKKVSDVWIADGLLKARKAPVAMGAHRMWRIPPGELERFIRCHPEHYDWRKMPHGPYRNMARAAWEKDPVLSADEAAAQLGICPETIRRHLRRGWLRAVRAKLKGNNGVWRIRQSALAEYRSRHPASVGNTWLKDSGRAVWVRKEQGCGTEGG